MKDSTWVEFVWYISHFLLITHGGEGEEERGRGQRVGHGVERGTNHRFISSWNYSRTLANGHLSTMATLEYSIIKLKAKRIKLNLHFKVSYLSSNFALTQGYLNPASNNPAQIQSKSDQYQINIWKCIALASKTQHIESRVSDNKEGKKWNTDAKMVIQHCSVRT